MQTKYGSSNHRSGVKSRNRRWESLGGRIGEARNRMAFRPVGSFSLLDKFLVLKVPNNRSSLEVIHVPRLENLALRRMEPDLVVEELRSSVGVDDATSTHHDAKAGKPARGPRAVC